LQVLWSWAFCIIWIVWSSYLEVCAKKILFYFLTRVWLGVGLIDYHHDALSYGWWNPMMGKWGKFYSKIRSLWRYKCFATWDNVAWLIKDMFLIWYFLIYASFFSYAYLGNCKHLVLFSSYFNLVLVVDSIIWL